MQATILIQYLESFTSSKWPEARANEDRILLRDGFCAVMDGATSKGTTTGPTGATVADLICAALDSWNMERPLRDLVAFVSEQVRAGLADAPGQNMRPSATLLVFVAAHRRILRVGDSHFAISGQQFRGQKPVDALLGEMRSLYLRLSQDWQPDSDPGRALILPVLQQQYRLQNNADFPQYGYGCIDGSPVPETFIEIHDVPADSEIVLCSDGYLSPAPSLAQAEAELRSALERDPACIDLHKSTKGLQDGQVSFDDRSYIRLRI